MIPTANPARFVCCRSMLAPARIQLGNMLSNEAFRSFVILNPASTAGATGRRWDRIAKLLRTSLGDFEHAATQKPGEASALARAGRAEGGAGCNRGRVRL
jgi:hypothetical protein